MSFDNTTNEIPYGYCHCGCGKKTSLAPHNDKASGAIKGEPRRYIKNHQRIRPLPDKFWEKVCKGADDECWHWIGAKTRLGYGSIGVNGKTLSAHRVAWMLAYGEIPSGHDVLHHCDNPACVNVYHLFLGTHADNMHDKIDKGRGNYKAGSRNHNAKLTEAKIIEIRQAASEGAIRTHLARQYGVSEGVIHCVIRRRTWKHVP